MNGSTDTQEGKIPSSDATLKNTLWQQDNTNNTMRLKENVWKWFWEIWGLDILPVTDAQPLKI